MDEKKDLLGMSTQEKLRTMVGWHHNKKERGPYTSAANDFFKKSIHPVMKCLENHFQGDVEAFATKYPEYAHTSFAKKCCKGRGDSCSL